MHRIEIPVAIRSISAVFILIGLWSVKKETYLRERARKMLFFICEIVFMISMAFGALKSDNNNERVYLTVISIIITIQLYRLWYILWEEKTILRLLREIGTHEMNDRDDEFEQVNRTQQFMLKLFRVYLISIFIGIVFVVILFPFVSTGEKRLIVQFAFPLDYNESNSSAFWMGYVYFLGGAILSTAGYIFATTTWYLMHCLVIKYQMLGNQIKNLNIRKGRKSGERSHLSLAEEQKIYVSNLAAAIRSYDDVNGMFDDFTSIFSNLFFWQVISGSVTICGAVYTMAFSHRDNLIEDGVNGIVIWYCFLDIFMVMHLANEIKLYTDKLSYNLYESNWIEQTQSCKKCVLIFGERLKKPREMIVGKIYALYIDEFTLIVNRAYSLFNILQNFR